MNDRKENHESLSYEESAEKISRQIANNIMSLPNIDQLLQKIDGPLGQLKKYWNPEEEALLFKVSFFIQRPREAGDQLIVTPHIEPITSGREKWNVQSQPMRLYRWRDEDLRNLTGKTREELADMVFAGIDGADLKVFAMGEIERQKSYEESTIIHCYETDDSVPLMDLEKRNRRMERHQWEQKQAEASVRRAVAEILEKGYCISDTNFFNPKKEIIYATHNDASQLEILVKQWALDFDESQRARGREEHQKIVEDFEILLQAVKEDKIKISIDPEQPTLVIKSIDTSQEPKSLSNWFISAFRQILNPKRGK